MDMVSDEESRGLTRSEDDLVDYGSANSDDSDLDSTAEQVATAAAPDDADANRSEQDEHAEITIAALTRRLRCLFHAITWPVVPLGTIVVLALLWMLHAAFFEEISNSCSHPLHWYAAASLIVLIYTPNHTWLRAQLFNYQRDRDGPNRPPNARRCDQVFHTMALLYVYAGITLVQTCHEDLEAEGDVSSCSATCPTLFRALSVYVVSLQVFTLSLVLPLLFLPCIYLWLLRQTTIDNEALVFLQERLRDEELYLRNGGVTADEIMSQLKPVSLVTDSNSNRVMVVSVDDKDFANAKDANGVKDCCICMSDFRIYPFVDEEMGATLDEDEDEAIVQTHCGHIMHSRCMASWVDGRWQQSSGDHEESGRSTSTRRAKRTTCPLCRTDLRS